MTSMDTVNLVAAAMTFVLGPLSIWLSLHFYSKAKDAEKETATALEAIKAQTGALERLTGKWMDRLTRYVTGPKPADESLTLLITTLAQMPTNLLSQFHTLGQGGPRPDTEALLAELTSCYIVIYYYVGISNVLGQSLLPDDPGEFDADDEGYALAQRVIDGSANDFAYMANLLQQVEPERLAASPYKHLLDEGVDVWRPQVRTTKQALRARKKS